MDPGLAPLARSLLEGGAAALLDRQLDALDEGMASEDVRSLLRALFEAGEARSLRDALTSGSLLRFVAETCTEREEAELVVQLRRWLGHERGGPDDPARLARIAPPPDDFAELVAWAREAGVAGELSRPAAEVFGAEFGLDVTLGDLLRGRELRTRSLLRGHSSAARVREHLASEAAQEASLGAREALWQTRVEGPLRPLVERLRALLAGTTPRALHGVRFVPARPVALDLESGVCTAQLVAGPGEPPVRVTLLLSGYEQRAIEGRCDACTRERCLHVRALAGRLVDGCLAADDRLHAPLKTFASVPSWRRFLNALEPGGERAKDDAARCTFVLSLEDGVAQLTALVQRAERRGAPRAVSPPKALRELALDDRDRTVLEAMAQALRTPGATTVNLDMTLFRALLEHPRVRLATHDEAVRVVEQSVEVELVEQPEGLLPRVTLAGVQVASGVRPRGVTYLWHHDRPSATLSVAALTPALARLLAALEHFRGLLPPESYPVLAPALSALRQVARVEAPRVLKGHEEPPPRKLLLRITPGLDQGVDVQLTTRPLPLGALWPPGHGPELVHGMIEGRAVYTRRDLAWERATAEQVHGALALSSFARLEPFAYRIDEDQAALGLLSAAARLGDVLDLEWAERARRLNVVGSVRSGDLKIGLFKKGEWFTLEGGVRNAQAHVAVGRLLDAVRRGERFVRVEGDDFLELEQNLFERLEAAQVCILERFKEAALPAAAAPYWRALFEEDAGPRDEVTARFLALVDEARRAPPELAGDGYDHLRSYQRAGVAWLLQRARWTTGVCIADEMGLGKTVQTIAVLRERAALGPALVVAPTSVVDNWLVELARFAPELAATAYRGAERKALLDALAPGQVLVTSYELVLRDREALSGRTFATQVIDEAQVVKNARTQRAQAVASVDAAFRIALSGTPVENRLGDVWSLFQLIQPGLLGSWPRFRARFAVPIERYENRERAEVLRGLVAPFILRRTKDEVLSELPARTEVVHMVELSPAEEELYASAVRHARLAIGKRSRDDAARNVQILAELTRLRQLACHPRLVLDDTRVHSSKLAALVALLDDILPRGHRALLFSQFTSHLALVREALDARGITQLYLDGSTPAGQRTELVRRFQEGEGQVFLISLKAGGTGLNLTAADYVVHLDPWWNPAVLDQASDRAHRLGQERPVTVVKLVARETIEERVLGLHEHKRRLADAVLLGEASPDALDASALEALLAD